MKRAYEKPVLVKREKLSSVVAGPSGPIGPAG
ncbi:putative RiPP precursor [Mesorhizobium sp. VK23B]|uniref:RiPP n=1 Tax=Mesorhizobium dulcispinae TaxID=3072316 RepID=A0ABU4XBX7_9HYPH|nr:MULTISPECIES: putative RiPP precursor [unclassified Mesorhizobium]MDX8466475.1 putative RiPP precursor [Mesorhizobium sp. VK23B]MDX8472285.1 putative RiPP precursor [Mesorhizobium sp. VK23A]MDX8521644.1 putative RiPP precursor [Mesorhizobium sp. VK23D]